MRERVISEIDLTTENQHFELFILIESNNRMILLQTIGVVSFVQNVVGHCYWMNSTVDREAIIGIIVNPSFIQ